MGAVLRDRDALVHVLGAAGASTDVQTGGVCAVFVCVLVHWCPRARVCACLSVCVFASSSVFVCVCAGVCVFVYVRVFARVCAIDRP